VSREVTPNTLAYTFLSQILPNCVISCDVMSLFQKKLANIAAN